MKATTYLRRGAFVGFLSTLALALCLVNAEGASVSEPVAFVLGVPIFGALLGAGLGIAATLVALFVHWADGKLERAQ